MNIQMTRNRFLAVALWVVSLAPAINSSAQILGADSRLPDFPDVAASIPKPKKPAAVKPPKTESAPLGDEHLVMGNPSGATADVSNADNYLMRKTGYVLSYNNTTHNPNWVSWHLNASWLGDTERKERFHPDHSLPPTWFHVMPSAYDALGFDAGHMCNSKDRTNSPQSNEETFLMTNMVPQSPRNNRYTWQGLERYGRKLATAGNELYIVAGPAGRGGEGDKGALKEIVVARHGVKQGAIQVPAWTWKVVLVLPHGKTSPRDVTANTATIGLITPNIQNPDLDWHKYIKTVSEIERLTGYRFFTEVDPKVASIIKNRLYQEPGLQTNATLLEKLEIDWKTIPGGVFTMGSDDPGRGPEMPAHPVSVRPFQMAASAITWKQYAFCVNAQKCTPIETGGCASWLEAFKKDENQPAVCATWQQAKDFAAFVGGRLPSEAEREYAARSAGQSRQYPWGDDAPTCEKANFQGCGNVTKPVCSTPAGNTDQGLCDMAGNNYDWCEDTWHSSYIGAPLDGSAWEENTLDFDRIMRGGSWGDAAQWLRTGYRGNAAPDSPAAYIGFRPVK